MTLWYDEEGMIHDSDYEEEEESGLETVIDAVQYIRRGFASIPYQTAIVRQQSINEANKVSREISRVAPRGVSKQIYYVNPLPRANPRKTRPVQKKRGQWAQFTGGSGNI